MRAKYQMLIVLQVLFAAAAVAENLGIRAEDVTCFPEKNCLQNTAGTNISDPISCRNYYVCITITHPNGTEFVVPSDDPLSCEGNTYFSPVGGKCMPDDDGSCINPCVKNECKLTCTEGMVESIAAPYNCSEFLVCIPGQEPLREPCLAETPYFNGAVCSTNKYECCAICTPFCKYAFTETADPLDCHNYYICYADNSIPSELNQSSCPEGSYFEPSRGNCQPETGEMCSPLCPPRTELLNY